MGFFDTFKNNNVNLHKNDIVENKQDHNWNVPFHAYGGDEPYIFVSYAHTDAKKVFPEIKRFHDDGYNIWYDQGISPGNEWTEEIAKALKDCSLFIVFITSNSVDSINVRNEINYALDKRKPFLAIYLEETELTGGIELRISSLQGILKYTTTDEEYNWRYKKVFEEYMSNVMEKPVETQSLEKPSQKQTGFQITESKNQQYNDKVNYQNSEYLEEFESLNTTTDSIYDLEGYEVLIILDDGTNLTSWNEVIDKSNPPRLAATGEPVIPSYWGEYASKAEVMYVSEDLSHSSKLSYKYDKLISLKAIVATGVTNKVRDMTNLFNGCDSLETLYGLNNWDTSKVTTMASLFNGCSSLVDVSALGNWDTSKVEDMEFMFSGCESLVDVSALGNWDTSKVKYMVDMFSGCESLVDVSALGNWDTSKVKNMDDMFSGCESLVDVSALGNWDTSKVKYMVDMFSGCESLVDISALGNWDTSKVEDMEFMFSGCESLVDVSALGNWDTSKVKNMDDVFKDCDEIIKYPKWHKG
ncbi:BspA family leucine-rich repeat surface protein [Methanosphaera sp. BMS]|uniref:BspA family leucine-rich repeat surface protein n=1 Tax=Methanosphaera sp. BMS TaxID=1789762 RepID=UPI000DC1C301|nr:BspA family leucine-rich repeat surface protein [Methanosphaera sp. BMS]AWX31717.1 hypothetical protein AW729_00830 [Methanosphaera sp. BMS]